MSNLKKRKVLILDESKWRCGGSLFLTSESCRRGVGATSLLNDKGYMCCLGQFIKQFDSTINLISITNPANIGVHMPLFNEYTGVILNNSEFSRRAIDINDLPTTSVETKVQALRELCKEFGY